MINLPLNMHTNIEVILRPESPAFVWSTLLSTKSQKYGWPQMEISFWVRLFTCICIWDIVLHLYVDKESWQHQRLVPFIPQTDIVIAWRVTSYHASYFLVTQEHLFDMCVYFKWLWVTNSSLLSHFNHMVLSGRVLFFSSDRKTMLMLIFFPFTMFIPTRENLKPYVIHWIIGPNLSLVYDLLPWGSACFGQWDVSDVVQAEA